MVRWPAERPVSSPGEASVKKLLIGIAVVVLLVVAAAIAAPFFIPVDTYKAKLADAVKGATGRELKIDGKIGLSILPRLALEVNQVSFANAPGASSKDMATLAKLQVELKLLPILSGEIAVDKFVLVDPVIQLEVDKQGHPNWVFAAPPPTTQPQAAQPTAPAPAQPTARPTGSGAASSSSSLQQVRLGDIR